MVLTKKVFTKTCIYYIFIGFDNSSNTSCSDLRFAQFENHTNEKETMNLKESPSSTIFSSTTRGSAKVEQVFLARCSDRLDKANFSSSIV